MAHASKSMWQMEMNHIHHWVLLSSLHSILLRGVPISKVVNATTVQEKRHPLPIYVALKVHAETRKRGLVLVDALHGLGLCISHDRTSAISTDVANSLCARFESEGVVCPPQAVTGVFTTTAIDNIDHKPSSTTSQGSFHSTAISLLQHPTQQCPGTPRAVTVIDNNFQGRTLPPLPDAYTLVNPVAVALTSPDPLVPQVAASMQLQPPTELNQLNSSVWLAVGSSTQRTHCWSQSSRRTTFKI